MRRILKMQQYTQITQNARIYSLYYTVYALCMYFFLIFVCVCISEDQSLLPWPQLKAFPNASKCPMYILCITEVFSVNMLTQGNVQFGAGFPCCELWRISWNKNCGISTTGDSRCPKGAMLGGGHLAVPFWNIIQGCFACTALRELVVRTFSSFAFHHDELSQWHKKHKW